MNSRQRFLETMDYGSPDHVPLLEEGIRSEVLRSWRQQGMAKNTHPKELFQYDERKEIRLDLRTHPPLVNWPRSVNDLEDLRERLDPWDPHRLPANWKQLVDTQTADDRIRILRVHRGFFQSMGVGDWERFIQVMNLLTDKPHIVRETMSIQARFTARLVKRVLNELKVDAAVFSEPIAGNHGPLISPKMYREFVLSSYRPLLDLLSKYGVKILIVRTYANVRILLPAMLDFGFNCLWACETNTAPMDYQELRQIFGRDLRLIGGIDIDVLREGREQIKRELFKKLPPLLEQGGYIPIANGRVREGISFENYSIYRQMLQDLVLS